MNPSFKYDHIYFSPHLDDVVLSCGGTVAKQVKKGEKVLVTTIFTRAINKPVSQFALGFVKSCGFKNPQKLFKARLIEDKKAAEILGFDTLRLDFLDAIFRVKKRIFFLHKIFPRLQFLYFSPGALMGERINKTDNFLKSKVLRQTKRIIKKYTRDKATIYFPLAIGSHIDHQILHKIGLRLAQKRGNILFYEDFPYLLWAKQGGSFHLNKTVAIKPFMNLKRQAIKAYKSQLKMLFGGEKFTLPPQEKFWRKAPIKKKLKILIVTNQKHVGGVNTVICETAKALADLNHEVFIVQGRSGDQLPLVEKSRRIRIFNYPVNEKNQIIAYFSILFGALKTFKKLIKKTSFDIIHCHLSHSAAGIMLSSKTRKTLKIYHFHGAPSLELKSRISRPKRHKILGKVKRFIFSFPFLFIEDAFLKICLRRADIIISPSQWGKRLLISRFKVAPSKIKVVNNGVNTKRFRPISGRTRRQIKKTLGFKRNFPMLTIITRLEPLKGIDNTIKALPLILKKYPKSLLAIAFPLAKDSRFYLETLFKLSKKLEVDKNIKFFKNPSVRKLVNLYRGSDCFLMVSKTLENFPLTILESLACGTPVLGTPVGGIPEALKPLNQKFLLKGISAEEIAKGVANFLSLSEKKKQVLRNKCVKYTQNFSWEKQTEELVGLYQKLLDNS